MRWGLTPERGRGNMFPRSHQPESLAARLAKVNGPFGCLGYPSAEGMPSR
jgi:hypothetical protein